ncbi:DUF222 domain-containing protein, partial [Arthrobacter ulcerisalmonis]|uniref:HNH endonuclease signature motif containing protein n=2 Tax=Arthrobacter ulcerisalmonis TaxID=2483813 RepID=UPI0039EC9224
MGNGVVVDAGGGADIRSAVASIAALVDQLSGVVSDPIGTSFAGGVSDTPGPAGTSTSSSVTGTTGQSGTATSGGTTGPAVGGTAVPGTVPSSSDRRTGTLAAVPQLSGETAGAADDAGAVDGGDPLRDFADSCLSGLEVLARVEAATAAAKVRLVAAYAEAADMLTPPSANGTGRGSSAVGMCVVSEVACVLTIGERAASALLCEAYALTGSLPVVLGALEDGTISWQHARVVVDETTGLTPDAVTAVVTHFFGTDTVNPPGQTTQETLDGLESLNGLEGLADVPGAGVGGVVVSRFRRKVRGWRERHHPESLEARHVKGVADRRVEFCPDRDGMGWLSMYLPGDTACAVWNKTTALARGLQGPNEDRTLTQLRADVAAGLLLNSPGHHLGTDAEFGAGVRAEVLVTVPVFSLLGLTEEPGEVDGFGPVPASVARRLVADGAQSLYRVLVDPRDGVPLELGRTRYRLSEGLKRWIRLRDGGCTFPGCSNQCLDNENDHLTAWADGGGTGVRNLGQVCPKHHRLKHQSTWTPTGATKDTSPGWVSPSGRYYPAEPPEREPTHLPP